MDRLLKRLGLLASPRSLLAMVLTLGALGGQGGRGSLAFFTSSVTGAENRFTAGTIDISSSTFQKTGVAFQWTTLGADGTQCASVLGTSQTGQAMAPGHYCVVPITINNTATDSLDAWMRIRLVRKTPTDSTAHDALNNRLKFYMHEYTGTGDRATAQTNDCTAASYKPTTPVVASMATSLGLIDDKTGVVTDVNRTAISMLTTAGRNVGVHPGLSSYNGAAIAGVSDLTAATIPHSGTGLTATLTGGLNLKDGTNQAAADLTEAAMVTAVGATTTAVNIIGNDEVKNPVITTGTAAHGTRPYGINAEAEILKGTSRYYCAAIFFPSDTDHTYPTVAGTTLTGGNTIGDNAAKLGDLTYYLTVTAAQKAGRTDQ